MERLRRMELFEVVQQIETVDRKDIGSDKVGETLSTEFHVQW